MSHVDEGALHAYLDGALDEYPAAEARRVREHVETCAACAQRLAQERELREEARAILDLAAPKVEVPTFEELRAYVRAGRSKRTVVSRMYKMSWAASVVLALGTGWMIRGSRIDPSTTFQAAESGTALTRGTEPAADQTAPAPTAPPVEEAERDALAPPAPQPAPASPTTTATLEPPAEPTAATGGAGAQAVGARADRTTSVAALDDQDVMDRLAGVAAPSTDVGPDVGTDVAFDVGVLAPAADTQRQLADPRPQERIDSAARVAEARRRETSDRADVTVTSSLDVAASAAPALQRARAANEVEREQREQEDASLVVPGLEVLAVLPVSEGTAFAGVRAYQRLESGDTLEVLHLPEGIAPDLLPAPAPGRNQLIRQTPEGWVVMRAPLSLLDLEQLLERLEGGR